MPIVTRGHARRAHSRFAARSVVVMMNQRSALSMGRRKARSSALRQIADIAVSRHMQCAGAIDPAALYRCRSPARNSFGLRRSKGPFGKTLPGRRRNDHTSRAYLNATRRFAAVQPVHVAAFVKELQGQFAPPTVKQHLAALRMLFDWLVTGHIIERTRRTPSAARNTSSRRARRRC